MTAQLPAERDMHDSASMHSCRVMRPAFTSSATFDTHAGQENGRHEDGDA
jgi:hypothetical protein